MSAIATPATPAEERSTPPLRALFGQRDFLLLWGGEAISLLGDQFYMIALPWMMLQLTGDAFAMGAVLALGGIPRALFMLVGGAITDRFSPRLTMLVSNLWRMLLIGLMALLIFSNSLQIWMIYVLALLLGLGDAIFFPAQSAIVPRIVDRAQLGPANAIVQATAQISLFVGPVIAGSVIALLSTAGESLDMRAMSFAFGIDTLTFVVSVLTLWLMRPQPHSVGSSSSSGLIQSIREGLVTVGRDVKLRTIFLIIAASNLLVVGPIGVGIPVLADTRFPEGAAAFGIIMSAYGGGSLLGTLLSGILPRPPARILGSILFVLFSSSGFGVALIGLSQTTALATVVALLMGIGQGYVVIVFITWLQARTAEAMLGRMMSLLMFASAGLAPVSNALAGALINLNVTAVFVGFGGLMALMALLAALNPATRALD